MLKRDVYFIALSLGSIACGATTHDFGVAGGRDSSRADAGGVPPAYTDGDATIELGKDSGSAESAHSSGMGRDSSSPTLLELDGGGETTTRQAGRDSGGEPGNGPDASQGRCDDTGAIDDEDANAGVLDQSEGGTAPPSSSPRLGTDLVAWSDSSLWIERSLGGSYAAPEQWRNGLYYGNIANLMGDVSGDGRADAVAWPDNDKVYVLQSTGTTFDGGATWTAGIVAGGSRASALADVNGDGKADLVAWSDDEVNVNLSTGTSFSGTTSFSASYLFWGSVANLVGDVTGDGLADLVAWNNIDKVYIMESTGTAFTPIGTWTAGGVAGGTRATSLGDVNGDHKADLVQWNDDDVKVYLSTGSAFQDAAVWASFANFYGSVASLVADADGDGKSDLVAWNANSISVALSTGSGFGAPQLWSSAPLTGTRAQLAAQVD